MILPADFGLPELPYLIALVVAAALTVGVLYVRRPDVTVETVTALTPWMAAGGGLYALYQADTIPPGIAPLFGSPAVYISVGIVAGLLWAALTNDDRSSDSWTPTGTPAILAGIGGLLLVAVLLVAAVGPTPRSFGTPPVVSVVIILVSLAVSAAVWLALVRFTDVSEAGTVGAVTVFGHTLDGLSTAVGYDVLGFGEQTPLSRLIIETGGSLPTAEFLGAAWLFILVKVVLGAAVVVLFEEYVRSEPTEGYLLLGLIAAVGLGPGFHNLVLFVIL